MFIGVQGNGIISFGSGQPDLPPPRSVYSASPVCRDSRYGLIQGMPELRDALARKYPDSTAENFVITNGASEALDLVLRVISSGSGKKILLPKPYYYSYPPLVRYSGMEPVYTNLAEGRIDIEDFEKKVKGCSAVLINSPSNPTGRVESLKTLKEIERITKEQDVLIISDEVYKDLIYTRDNYMIKGRNVITINSFSKTYSMCGFRIGYLWAHDRKLIEDVIEMKTHTSMNTSLVSQDMALAATKVKKSFVSNQLKIWKGRRDVIYEGLASLGMDLWSPEGAFYVLPKVGNSERFVMDMYRKHKVITYMGEWFGAPGRVRFSYALDEAKILEGLERVGKYLKSVKF